MKPHAPILLSLVLSASIVRATPLPPDVIPAQGGPIRITPIYHGSLQIEYRGKVIQVDPFNAGDYSKAKKADVILITHTHPDHLDRKAINMVLKDYTRTMAPLVAARTLAPETTRERVGGLDSGFINNIVYAIDSSKRQSLDFSLAADAGEPRVDFTIGSVPMYNIVRGPKPGQKFHPKGQFNGYVLTLGGKRIYIAGDTEATPEMKALKNIDVAFLPMNLPYTMTPQEAALGARAFKPKLVYPYHYRYPFTKANNNPQQFAAALKGSGIQVRLRDWYANPAKK